MTHFIHDPVVIILAIFSLVSWTIIFHSIFKLNRFKKNKPSLPSDLDDKSKDYIYSTVDASINDAKHQLEAPLPLLGAIGSVSPYIGLLGTVIGIIQAFQAIQMQNNMSPSVVSGGIALALITTAGGLIVAIPAVMGYNLIASAIGTYLEVLEDAYIAEIKSHGLL